MKYEFWQDFNGIINHLELFKKSSFYTRGIHWNCFSFFFRKMLFLTHLMMKKTIKFTKKHQIFKWMPLRNSQSHSTLDCLSVFCFTIYTIKRFYFCSSFTGLDLVSITIHSNKLAKYCNIRSSVEIFRTRYPGDSHALRWEKWWKYLFTTLITTEYKNLLCDYKFVLLGCI